MRLTTEEKLRIMSNNINKIKCPIILFEMNKLYRDLENKRLITPEGNCV